MKAILLFLALLSVSLALAAPAPYIESEYQYLFTKWMSQNQKNYEIEDFFNRYSIFKDNLNFIHDHNSKNYSYTVGINEFADLNSKEFKARNTLLPPPPMNGVQSKAPHDSVHAPLVDIDWRARNAVSPVKNQQQCGSCYAFSSISAIETAWAIKRGTLYQLSEQQIVDCTTTSGNLGCNGGSPQYVYDYVIKNKGVSTMATYPYTAVVGSCKNYAKAPVTISGYSFVANENVLVNAVNIGSVVVLIEADTSAFQFYSSGVFDNPACGTNVDHGVVVVGYGAASGKNYWIVRNSWGPTWGESGYIRMVRGKNMCAIGLANGPSYPTSA